MRIRKKKRKAPNRNNDKMKARISHESHARKLVLSATPPYQSPQGLLRENVKMLTLALDGKYFTNPIYVYTK